MNFVLIPFLLICKLVERNKLRYFSLSVLAVTLLVFLVSNFSSRLFDFVISMPVFSNYKLFYTGKISTNSYGLGFVLLSIPYVIMIYYMICRSKDISEDEKYLIILSYAAFLTKPFEFIGAALVARIGYCFSVFDITIIPILYRKIKIRIFRVALYISLFVITIYSYLGFFADPTYKDSFAEFHTIFELFK